MTVILLIDGTTGLANTGRLCFPTAILPGEDFADLEFLVFHVYRSYTFEKMDFMTKFFCRGN
jgi:hypothetical protein